MVQEHTPSDPTPGQDPIQGSCENAFNPPMPAEPSEDGGGSSWLLEPEEARADSPVVIGEGTSEPEALVEQVQAPSASFDNGHLEATYVAEEPKFSPRTAMIPIVAGALLAFAGSAAVSLRSSRQSTDPDRFPKPIALTEDLNPEVELAGPVFDTQGSQGESSQPSGRRSIDRHGDVAPARAFSMPAERKPAAAPKQASESKPEPLSQADERISDREQSPVEQALALSKPPTEERQENQGQQGQQVEPGIELPIELQQAESEPLSVAQGDTPPPPRPASWDEIPAQSRPSTASPVAQAESTQEPAQDSTQESTQVSPEETTEDSSVASLSVKDPFPLSVVIEPAPWFGESIDLTLEPLWPELEAWTDSTDDLALTEEPILIEDSASAAQESDTDVFAEMDQEGIPEEPISLPDRSLLALESWPGQYQEHGLPESLPVGEESLVAQLEMPAPEAAPEAAPVETPVAQEEFWLGPDGIEWSPSTDPNGAAVAVQDEPVGEAPAEPMDELAEDGLSPEVAALLALSEDDLERQRQENGLEVGPQLELPEPEVAVAVAEESEGQVSVAQVRPEPTPEPTPEVSTQPQPETDAKLVAAGEPEPQPEPSLSAAEPAAERAPRNLLRAYSDWMRLADQMPAEMPVLAAVNGVPGSAYAPYSLSQEQGDLQPAELKTEDQGVEVALSSAPFAGGVLRRASSGHRWEGVEVPVQAILAERKLLTPNVGPVRVDLVDGQSLEGRLHSVGFNQLWLNTSLGQITLENRRIAQIHKLDPGLGMPTLHGRKDYSNFPHVRVTAKGGTFVGYQIAREGNTITMVTEQGFRITLTDVQINPARQYRTVDLRRVEDYEAEKAVTAE